MATASTSVQWRVEGNSKYLTVTDNLPPVIKKARYQEALNCYESAYSAGTCDVELSSAAKNAGLSTWKLAKLALDTGLFCYIHIYMYMYTYIYIISYTTKHNMFTVKSYKCRGWEQGSSQ